MEKFEFAFAPGASFAYSGEGFYYLKCVVEQITGQSIELFLQERVLRPTGMEHSTFASRNGYESKISMGHRDRGNKVVPWILQQAPKIEELATCHPKAKTIYTLAVSRKPRLPAAD